MEAAEKPGIRIFMLDGMTIELAAKFERYFDLLSDPKFAEEYSVAGLFGFVANHTPDSECAVYCSQCVMQTIRKLAHDLLPLVRCGDNKSPADLLWSPRLIELQWADL